MALNEINFYFNSAAYKDAFEDTNSEVVFAVEGDIYKDTIDQLNLVVSNGGEVGSAGGSPVPVRVNDMNIGAISNMVEYTRRICAYFVDQMDLQKAVGRDLDWYGETMFNIYRRAGEEDSEYRQRIVSDIFAIKGTKWGIRDVISEFAEQVIIDDDVSSGAFADVTFSDYYREHDPSDTHELVRGAIAGTFGGLIFHYDCILTNPDYEKRFEIIRLLKDYTVGGVSFNIFIDNT